MSMSSPRIAVACFFFQHSCRLPFAFWALLHAYLGGGLAAAAPWTGRVRQLNSHRRGGRAPQAWV
jgi:hypothetical protein